ncbi:hypothetical protein PAF17_12080 [Paracoccus sp. Z330]|uniref:Uncharacterized protein n=1 Tax=Paracoccus onchidii TaxID=3017813 RepID=A0ABT4ZFX2_9RHOB|nr:phosphoribosyl-AMP cyclohydrolase [Paracoccus onchidii]MDB6178233.1 hypothetical protein [Paracoccus onchidii]
MTTDARDGRVLMIGVIERPALAHARGLTDLDYWSRRQCCLWQHDTTIRRAGRIEDMRIAPDQNTVWLSVQTEVTTPKPAA